MAKTRCTGASVVVVALAREERVLNALLSRIDTIVPPPTPKAASTQVHSRTTTQLAIAVASRHYVARASASPSAHRHRQSLLSLQKLDKGCCIVLEFLSVLLKMAEASTASTTRAPSKKKATKSEVWEHFGKAIDEKTASLVKDWYQDDQDELSGDLRSELERYLSSPREPKNETFDLLMWWNAATSTYKVLSLMARDILAIPVSTVASESAFSTSGRVLDQFRSSLTPKFVEALICCQDWLRSSSKSISVEQYMEDAEKYEEELTCVTEDIMVD